MNRSRVFLATLLSLLFATAAGADCFTCGFEGTDVACLKKKSGWTTCTTQSGPRGQKCEATGDKCGEGIVIEPEQPMVWNLPCSRERLLLVDVQTRGRQSAARLALVGVDAPRTEPSL